jgi:hypothetical protein
VSRNTSRLRHAGLISTWCLVPAFPDPGGLQSVDNIEGRLRQKTMELTAPTTITSMCGSSSTRIKTHAAGAKGEDHSAT